MDTSFISRYWHAIDDLKGKKELAELGKAYVEAWKNAEVAHIAQLNSAKQNEKFTGKPFPFNSLKDKLTTLDLDFKKRARFLASMHLSEEQLNKANPDIKGDELDPDQFADKRYPTGEEMEAQRKAEQKFEEAHAAFKKKGKADWGDPIEEIEVSYLYRAMQGDEKAANLLRKDFGYTDDDIERRMEKVKALDAKEEIQAPVADTPKYSGTALEGAFDPQPEWNEAMEANAIAKHERENKPETNEEKRARLLKETQASLNEIFNNQNKNGLRV